MNDNSGAVWLKTSRAARALDMNPIALLRKRKELEEADFIQEHNHFRKGGKGKNCHYYFNVDAMVNVLSKWEAPKGGES